MIDSLHSERITTNGKGAGDRVIPTDGELLMRFSTSGDREAIELILQRHAGMVWGVCRQVLRQEQDAEDAFQATFHILLRRASTINANDSAAGWLYRVALRTALAARQARSKRREETLAGEPPAPEEAFPDLATRQTTAVLMEELNGLPKKYHTPLVMRYLEGQSRRAIADQTDATIASVQGLLVRGKRMLRLRLARRGVSLAVAMGVVTGVRSSHAAPTPTVLTSTGSLATASAAAGQLVTHGVRTMLISTYAKPAAALAAFALAAVVVTAKEEPKEQAESSSRIELHSTPVPASSIEIKTPIAIPTQAPMTGKARSMPEDDTYWKLVVEGLVKDPYGPKLPRKDAQWLVEMIRKSDPKNRQVLENLGSISDKEDEAFWKLWKDPALADMEYAERYAHVWKQVKRANPDDSKTDETEKPAIWANAYPRNNRGSLVIQPQPAPSQQSKTKRKELHKQQLTLEQRYWELKAKAVRQQKAIVLRKVEYLETLKKNHQPAPADKIEQAKAEATTLEAEEVLAQSKGVEVARRLLEMDSPQVDYTASAGNRDFNSPALRQPGVFYPRPSSVTPEVQQPVAQNHPSVQTPQKNLPLKPGDLLVVVMERHATGYGQAKTVYESRTVQLAKDGSITPGPYANSVKIAGLTPAKALKRAQKAFPSIVELSPVAVTRPPKYAPPPTPLKPQVENEHRINVLWKHDGLAFPSIYKTDPETGSYVIKLPPQLAGKGREPVRLAGPIAAAGSEVDAIKAYLKAHHKKHGGPRAVRVWRERVTTRLVDEIATSGRRALRITWKGADGRTVMTGHVEDETGQISDITIPVSLRPKNASRLYGRVPPMSNIQQPKMLAKELNEFSQSVNGPQVLTAEWVPMGQTPPAHEAVGPYQRQPQYGSASDAYSQPEKTPGEPIGAALPPSDSELPRDSAKLSPGDTIGIQVLNAIPTHPIQDTYAIERMGTVALGPTYGRVKVAGKTILEAEKALREALSKTLQDPVVQVTQAPKRDDLATRAALKMKDVDIAELKAQLEMLRAELDGLKQNATAVPTLPPVAAAPGSEFQAPIPNNRPWGPTPAPSRPRASAGLAPEPPSHRTTKKSTLKPGDTLVFEVVSMPDGHDMGFPKNFTVEPGGTVSLGAVWGRAKIDGKTITEAEEEIVRTLHKALDDARELMKDATETEKKKQQRKFPKGIRVQLRRVTPAKNNSEWSRPSYGAPQPKRDT